MTPRHKSFPPGLGNIKIPVSSRPAAVSALALYSACKPHTLWLHRAALAVAKRLGAAALPGRSSTWSPPMESDVWHTLRTQWQRELGSFDDFAICERTQAHRWGFAMLLLQQGRPLAFLKVRRSGAAALGHEHRVMQAVWQSGPRSFSVPQPLGFGQEGDWAYLATAALASPRHRVPRNPAFAIIAAEIQVALRSLPREPTTPQHWLPMHGDFAPWNLRELPGGGLVLFDWEDADWAPPQADEVLYRAVAAALGIVHPELHPGTEAIQYWHHRVSSRADEDERHQRHDQAVCRILAQMRGGSLETPSAVVPGTAR